MYEDGYPSQIGVKIKRAAYPGIASILIICEVTKDGQNEDNPFGKNLFTTKGLSP